MMLQSRVRTCKPPDQFSDFRVKRWIPSNPSIQPELLSRLILQIVILSLSGSEMLPSPHSDFVLISIQTVVEYTPSTHCTVYEYST